MDLLKDVFSAYAQRIRSPFAGSIVVAFIAINWKPLWFLLFGEATTLEKIAYFDGQTSWQTLYLYPVLVGAPLAVALPWLRIVGAWVASAPIRKLKLFEHDEALSHRVYQLTRAVEEETAKAELAAAKEQAVIDASKRLKEAQDVGQDAKDKLLEERAQSELGDTPEAMSEKELGRLPFALDLLNAASDSFDGQISVDNYSVRISVSGNEFSKPYYIGDNHKDALKIADTMAELVEHKAFRQVGESEHTFEITKLGYDVLSTFAK